MSIADRTEFSRQGRLRVAVGKVQARHPGSYLILSPNATLSTMILVGSVERACGP